MDHPHPAETEFGQGTPPHFSLEPDSADNQAWEEIETGRFMPRRIRGSFRGRALG